MLARTSSRRFARTTMHKLKQGKTGEAVALLRELEGMVQLATPWRIYTAETGERPVIVTIMESEDVGDLFDRARNLEPGEASAWFQKWDEVAEPGSRTERVWEVR